MIFLLTGASEYTSMWCWRAVYKKIILTANLCALVYNNLQPTLWDIQQIIDPQRVGNTALHSVLIQWTRPVVLLNLTRFCIPRCPSDFRERIYLNQFWINEVRHTYVWGENETKASQSCPGVLNLSEGPLVIVEKGHLKKMRKTMAWQKKGERLTWLSVLVSKTNQFFLKISLHMWKCWLANSS